jgi:hypothetical protein
MWSTKQVLLLLLLAVTVGAAVAQSVVSFPPPDTILADVKHKEPKSLELAAHVDYLSPVPGAAAREPMIVEHPDGTLFVSGYGYQESGPLQTVPRLWKSADQGATWTTVNVGTEADGAIGNSDVALAVARDGTLYFVRRNPYRSRSQPGCRKDVALDNAVKESFRRSSLGRGGAERHCACDLERQQRGIPPTQPRSRCHVE